MLVSHETPVSFLETSRRYNDYDYALVHLFETNPEYYSFFKSSKTLGREVLLDNSIFELGEAFDTKNRSIKSEVFPMRKSICSPKLGKKRYVVFL